jgi:hypothetical protein
MYLQSRHRGVVEGKVSFEDKQVGNSLKGLVTRQSSVQTVGKQSYCLMK